VDKLEHDKLKMWKVPTWLLLLTIIGEVTPFDQLASVVPDVQYPEDDNLEQTVWAPYPPLEGQCPDLNRKYKDAMVVLKNLEDGMLGDMCDSPDCTKIIVTSNGLSAVKQPTRFGLFFLHGWNEHDSQGVKYPSYFRPASAQYVFYMHELGEWEYWHSYDRWVIGPIHNKAVGGIMIKPYNPDMVCPWEIKWFRTHRWYHDVNIPNLWNPIGNPWKIDDTIFIECYDEESWPEFDCTCNRFNITNEREGNEGRVKEYHPDRLGEYTKLTDMHKEGYLAPVYGKVSPGAPSYLYSHHPKGKVWLLGSTTSTWSLRLNKLSSSGDHDCPFDWKAEEEWEYLQSKKGEKEVWLRDTDLKIECLDEE